MSHIDARSVSKTGLMPGQLGTADIIFMILACAAPLGVLGGLVPLAFAFGNGAGTPGTMLLICLVMLIFAVGYVRMIPHVRNVGAFYAYIATSLNKQVGVAAAYVAIIAYICASTSTLGAMAFFSTDFVQEVFGVTTRWEMWAAISVALIAYLSYRKITMAAKVLAVLLILEVAFILVLDVLILYHVGFDGLDFSSFTPAAVLAPGFGISIIYAINGVVGFEATAIYREEARNSLVTIPRATYGAILVLGTFYVFSSWCLVLSVTPEKLQAVAAADPGRLLTGMGEHYLGELGRHALNLLVVTSLFAAALGFANNIARYLFAVARDGLIPAVLGKVHPQHGSPYVACLFLTCIFIVVIGTFALAGLDPLLNLATSLSSMGAVGLMCLLTTTSFSICVFFIRRGEYSLAKTGAPLLAGLLLAIATCLSLANYSALTGTDSVLVNNLPFLFLAVVIAGYLHGSWLKRNRPSVYLKVGSTRVEEEVLVPAAA
ncbi:MULTISPECIES: APC family permease [Alcaligenes]|uniref:APC family permease n=2 Tax=Alcaligenes TaxID=507 RepID=A0AAE9H8T9_ALCFA|nr:APC family permease [Alcaligenes faecalis]UPL20339.1 APC family permease [Alcaligenes faecalis]